MDSRVADTRTTLCSGSTCSPTFTPRPPHTGDATTPTSTRTVHAHVPWPTLAAHVQLAAHLVRIETEKACSRHAHNPPQGHPPAREREGRHTHSSRTGSGGGERRKARGGRRTFLAYMDTVTVGPCPVPQP
jgi:hypothetical protein